MDQQTTLTSLINADVPDDPQLGSTDNARNISKKDDGEAVEEYATKGSYNYHEVKSLLVKAVRRSDSRVAMWCAWELCRSGADIRDQFWTTLIDVTVCDTLSEDAPICRVREYEDLCKEVWSQNNGLAIQSAMSAAKIVAEATSSHETEHVKNWWKMVAYSEANDGDRPNDFPDLSGEHNVALDMHTYRGKQMDRRGEFFHTDSSRTSHMTDLEKEAKRKILQHSDKYDLTDEELEKAVSEAKDWSK